MNTIIWITFLVHAVGATQVGCTAYFVPGDEIKIACRVRSSRQLK